MCKKTPLYEKHLEAKGDMVPFAGYELPVQYPTGLITEHLAVRNHVGIFDVSHMGEILVEGPGALDSLNHILTNNFTTLAVGGCRYSLMCYEDGGCVDDLIVYRRADDKFYVVVNAANKDKDVAWMKEHLLPDTYFEDVSEKIAQIAVQGPDSEKVLSRIMDPAQIPAKYYTFNEGVEIAGAPALISQTGYTGEFGFEIYCKAEDGAQIWQALLDAGEPEGLIPCGLGARDTLRLEAAMPLYGHEMDETITPYDTGLNFGVKPVSKPEFIGKEALVASKTNPKWQRIGLEVTGKGIVREHEDIYLGEEVIGHTTSGTHCPYLGKAIAMALVKPQSLEIGDKVQVKVRKRMIECQVVPLPFYKHA